MTPLVGVSDLSGFRIANGHQPNWLFRRGDAKSPAHGCIVEASNQNRGQTQRGGRQGCILRNMSGFEPHIAFGSPCRRLIRVRDRRLLERRRNVKRQSRLRDPGRLEGRRGCLRQGHGIVVYRIESMAFDIIAVETSRQGRHTANSNRQCQWIARTRGRREPLVVSPSTSLHGEEQGTKVVDGKRSIREVTDRVACFQPYGRQSAGRVCQDNHRHSPCNPDVADVRDSDAPPCPTSATFSPGTLPIRRCADCAPATPPHPSPLMMQVTPKHAVSLRAWRRILLLLGATEPSHRSVPAGANRSRRRREWRRRAG